MQAGRAGSRRSCGRTRVGGYAAALLAAACLTAPLALPAPAHAVSATDAAAAAAAVTQAAAVPTGWSGSSATCTTGTESAASLDATLQAVNAFRSVAGLGPVTFDAALSQQALAAAMMMRAENSLSHDPPQMVSEPGGGSHPWKCWNQEGHDAAGRSNLALGSSGAAAIRLYVADENVTGLGHRRWILDPAASTFGSGSTGTTNALTVFGSAPSPVVASGRQVAWPPSGAITPVWIPSTWSVSVGGNGDNVGLTSPVVSMTLDGAPVGVSGVSDLGTGYGTGRAIGWVPSIDRSALRTGYHELAVSVTGFTVNGVAAPVNYTTTVGTPPAATPAPPLPQPVGTPTTPSSTVVDLPRLQPKITRSRGRLRPGMHLTANFKQGTGRIVTRIQWLRGATPIKRANAVRLKVTASDRGRALRVKVWSQSRTGAAQLVEQSTAVKVPRR